MPSEAVNGPPALESFDQSEGSEPRLLDALFQLPRAQVRAATALLIGAILLGDTLTRLQISLGLLYMIPIVAGSLVLRRAEILVLALVCALLREHFGPNSWEPLALTRLVSTLVTFGVIGLLVGELARNRRMQMIHMQKLRDAVARWREAEQQMRMLVESSPAAIITADAGGRIELANRAAHDLLELAPGELAGKRIGDYLPSLGDVLEDGGLALRYRTTTTCRGRRAGGEQFLASVWFTSFATRKGPKMAAIFADNSEDIRDLQEANLQNLLRSTRVLVGSVSHEIRNVCAAIGVVHANLGRIPGVKESEDYVALSTLAESLARLASVELQSANEQESSTFSLGGLIEEFRIVTQPALAEHGIELTCAGVEDAPRVVGDHHSLLQVFLNLSRNSIRAMQNSPERRITIDAETRGDEVLVRFRDTGPGVAHPERMFRAFQVGADSAGLGLFVSRSLVRASGGELYHEPAARGCTICLRLRLAAGQEQPARSLSPEIQI